jgi:hypothetical protein
MRRYVLIIKSTEKKNAGMPSPKAFAFFAPLREILLS